MLTKDEIDELERLHKEATPGEWRTGVALAFCLKTHGEEEKGPYHGNGFCDYTIAKWIDDDTTISCAQGSPILVENSDSDGYRTDFTPSDSAFIVTVRNLLPRIIAALREKS